MNAPRPLADEHGAAPAGLLDVADDAGAPTSRPHAVYENFRATLVTELDAMARHLLSEGHGIDEFTVSALRRVERGEVPPIEELISAHANLSALVAPATPRAILALQDGQSSQRGSGFLGPIPAVRRIAVANLLFALLFFGLALSPRINDETIALSIYDQDGLNLLLKLLFMMSAAGLGASFGALFEIWQEISERRFDPITESAHWMRIGLGVVAGLVLSEIVQTDPHQGGESAALAAGSSVIAQPLLALIGGFSARLLHLIVGRLVGAVESAFEPPQPARPYVPTAALSAPARERPSRPPPAVGGSRERRDDAE